MKFGRPPSFGPARFSQTTTLKRITKKKYFLTSPEDSWDAPGALSSPPSAGIICFARFVHFTSDASQMFLLCSIEPHGVSLDTTSTNYLYSLSFLAVDAFVCLFNVANGKFEYAMISKLYKWHLAMCFVLPASNDSLKEWCSTIKTNKAKQTQSTLSTGRTIARWNAFDFHSQRLFPFLFLFRMGCIPIFAPSTLGAIWVI